MLGCEHDLKSDALIDAMLRAQAAPRHRRCSRVAQPFDSRLSALVGQSPITRIHRPYITYTPTCSISTRSHMSRARACTFQHPAATVLKATRFVLASS